ncbi:Uncharacterised protein [Kingella potus]|uniref:Uncharacterized protein n=1 Tax=Kingella potus TaxID=265175 RepID=A0A377QYT5_9NEIS|nr:Uncharacterised protein [Kingella potus]
MCFQTAFSNVIVCLNTKNAAQAHSIRIMAALRTVCGRPYDMCLYHFAI